MIQTKRIQVKDADLCVVAGPVYEVWSEDGPIHRYDYFVVFHNRAKDGLTWAGPEFRRPDKAEKALAAIVEHGSINPDCWTKGDPWWDYHLGMSLEERWAPFGPEWEAEQKERQDGWLKR